MSFEHHQSLSGFFETGSEDDCQGAGQYHLYPQKVIDTNKVIEIACQLGVPRWAVQNHLGLFDRRHAPDVLKENKIKYKITKLWDFKKKDEINFFQEHVEFVKEVFYDHKIVGPTIRYLNVGMYDQDIISFNLYGDKSNSNPQAHLTDSHPHDDVYIVRFEAIYVYLHSNPFLRCYDFLFELKKEFGPSFLVSTHSRFKYDSRDGFIYYFARNIPSNRYLSLERLDWMRSFLNVGYMEYGRYSHLTLPLTLRERLSERKIQEVLAPEERCGDFWDATIWGDGYVRFPWREPFVEKSARYALALREATGCNIFMGDLFLNSKRLGDWLVGPFVRGQHY